MTDGTVLRYVALGDSQTEGVGDGDDTGGLRGWADRLAELLAHDRPGTLYANLAVRGRLAGQVRAEQLAPALALRPDLATVVAGFNDLLRPGFDADETAGHLERCSPRSPGKARAWRPSPSRTSAASPRWPGRSSRASGPSTRASARSRGDTASSSSRPATTRSSPTPGCGAPTGCTPGRWVTRASPPPSPRPSACPAPTTPGPTRCHHRTSPARGPPRRTALGRLLPGALAGPAVAGPVVRRRPRGQAPGAAAGGRGMTGSYRRSGGLPAAR